MKKYRFNSTMQKNRKTLILLVFICIVFTMQLFGGDYVVSAETSETSSAISASISDIVSALDLSGLDEIVSSLESSEFFGMTAREKVELILSGEYFTDYSSLISAIFSLLFVNIKSFLPIIFTILAIGVLGSLLSSLKEKSNETGDMVYYVCSSIVTILILVSFKNILSDIKSVIDTISKLMQIVFPILISLLVSIGSLSSVSIYNPLVAVLTTIVDIVFDKFLYPIFILIFLFTVLGSLTTTIKLDKLNNFLSSGFKWVVGIIFTLFSGFLSLQGISAGRFDSISIKATKFAVKSYIPIIGSYMAEGMDFVVLGSVLVKNTMGLVAVLILFSIILIPVIKLIIYKLLLQFSSGVLELVGANNMSSFVYKTSKVLILPIIIVLSIALMFIMTIAIIMCTANIF